MKRHQYAGILLLLAGGVIAIYPKFRREPPSVGTTLPQIETNSTESSPVDETQSSVAPKGTLVPKVLSEQKTPTSTVQQHKSSVTHIDYLVERALREAEAAAQRAAKSFMKEMMAPVEANDRSFAEKLYSIGANAKAVAKNESDYRDYVSKRFYEELTRNTDMQKNLDAIAFEYLNRLDRIAQKIAIESGLDVTNLPTVKLTSKDFDKLLRTDIRESIGEAASAMQKQSREGTVIQTVSFGIGLLMPTMWVVDLAIGLGIDTTANSFRDPVGDVAINAHRAAENLAERICFGTDQHQGLYSALLDIAHYQNEQLREALMHSELISETGGRDAIFKENHE